VLGCHGSSSTDRGDLPDASAAPIAPARAGFVEGVRTEFARAGWEHVARGDAKIARSKDTFVSTFSEPVRATVRLPARADAAFELQKGDMAVRARLLDAHAAPGAIDGDAVVYPNVFDGATLFHVPTTAGTEEYVRFDAKPASAQLRYRLAFDRVAGLRLVDGDVFELLDHDGNPVLRTTAPWVIDANGIMRRGSLALEDCSYDPSAAAPWGRPVVAPPSAGCTLRVSWNDDGLAYPLLVDPPWTDTGALATKRYQHAATRISGSSATACTNGCVLVTGGVNGTLSTGSLVSAAELYNVGTKTFAAAGSSVARRMHTQIDMANGTAIVIGGAADLASPPTATTSVQAYAPSSGWSNKNPLPAARYGHASLRSGSVYVTGGYSSGTSTPQASMYVFDGTNWTTGSAMGAARARHQMAYLVNGTTWACDGFVVAGGIGAGGTSIASVAYYGVTTIRYRNEPQLHRSGRQLRAAVDRVRNAARQRPTSLGTGDAHAGVRSAACDRRRARERPDDGVGAGAARRDRART